MPQSPRDNQTSFQHAMFRVCWCWRWCWCRCWGYWCWCWCVCVRACACACSCVYSRVYSRVCVCVCVRAWVGVRVCVYIGFAPKQLACQNLHARSFVRGTGSPGLEGAKARTWIGCTCVARYQCHYFSLNTTRPQVSRTVKFQSNERRTSEWYRETMTSSTVRFLLKFMCAPQNLSPANSTRHKVSLAWSKGG